MNSSENIILFTIDFVFKWLMAIMLVVFSLALLNGFYMESKKADSNLKRYNSAISQPKSASFDSFKSSYVNSHRHCHKFGGTMPKNDVYGECSVQPSDNEYLKVKFNIQD